MNPSDTADTTDTTITTTTEKIMEPNDDSTGTEASGTTSTTTTTTTTTGKKGKVQPTRLLAPTDPEPPKREYRQSSNYSDTRRTVELPPHLFKTVSEYKEGDPLPDLTYCLNVWRDTRPQEPDENGKFPPAKGMGYAYYTCRGGKIVACEMVGFTRWKFGTGEKEHLIFNAKGNPLAQFKDHTTPPAKAIEMMGFPVAPRLWDLHNQALKQVLVDAANNFEKFNIKALRSTFSEFDPTGNPFAHRGDRGARVYNERIPRPIPQDTFSDFEKNLLERVKPDADVVESEADCDGFISDINTLLSPPEGSIYPALEGKIVKVLTQYIGEWILIRNKFRMDTSTTLRVGAPASALAKKAAKSEASRAIRDEGKGGQKKK